jgi:integrase/recombinase XerD
MSSLHRPASLQLAKNPDAPAIWATSGCQWWAVQRLLAQHVKTAMQLCLSLRRKRVTPHVLRHSAAMELIQAGVDCSVIALWLGHESIKTTQVYLHAHMALKEAALAKVKPFDGQMVGRYKPCDRLLAFLDAL